MRTHLRSTSDLGNLIRTLRINAGLSQSELAEQLGTSQRYVSELELGKPKRVDSDYFALLNALGIRLEAHTEHD